MARCRECGSHLDDCSIDHLCEYCLQHIDDDNEQYDDSDDWNPALIGGTGRDAMLDELDYFPLRGTGLL
jgi:hypothetical protein